MPPTTHSPVTCPYPCAAAKKYNFHGTVSPAEIVAAALRGIALAVLKKYHEKTHPKISLQNVNFIFLFRLMGSKTKKARKIHDCWFGTVLWW
jgi:hypothetical protein